MDLDFELRLPGCLREDGPRRRHRSNDIDDLSDHSRGRWHNRAHHGRLWPDDDRARESPRLPVILSECGPVGLECDYHDCSFPDFLPRSRVTCMEWGGWEWTMKDECEPPECPNQDMHVGLPCNGSLYTGPCPSYDGCERASPVWCVDGTWQAAGGMDTAAGNGGTDIIVLDPGCPSLPPSLGGLCCPAWYAPHCDYHDYLGMGAPAAVSAVTGSYAPDGPIAACVMCAAEGVWRESTDCD